ncbi:MAG: S1/P1 nuclease [Saprospiraceae bacterium]
MKYTLSFILLLSQFHLVLAWGPNGHRIVAEICELHLSAGAKAEIQQIIGKNYLAEIANWPDYVKSEKGWDFAETWHYTTVHPNQSVAQMKVRYAEDSKINDATEAIVLMKKILNNDKNATLFFEDLMKKNRAKPLNNSTKATALAFLIHIVADIHQPLHVGKNRDHGGNKITVMFFNKKTNLHRVWDSDIIEHEKLSYTEFAHFINKMTHEEIKICQKSTMNEWAEESIYLRERIYNTLYNYTDRESGLPSFSWQYHHDFIPLVKERLQSAGVRMAGILEDVFG